MGDMKSEMEKRGFASTECSTHKIPEVIASLREMIERMGSVCITQTSPLDQEIIRERLTNFVMEDEDDEDDDIYMLFAGDGGNCVDETTAILDEERQMHCERNHQQAMDHVKKEANNGQPSWPFDSIAFWLMISEYGTVSAN